MAEERLDLRKEVFNKAQYIKTINTSFDEFGATTITEELELQPTVEEFFGLYNSLFYDIPSLGETNSHRYLVRTSGDYINFEEISEEVQALQAEIAQLRSDLLSAQMANVRVAASASNDPSTNTQLAALEAQLLKANGDLINTATSLSDNAISSTNIDINIPTGGDVESGDISTDANSGGSSASGGSSTSGG
tara:strand:- start:1711 stop:2286 length:576 start_codon:yes stop_codon:yes gene_type:complete